MGLARASLRTVPPREGARDPFRVARERTPRRRRGARLGDAPPHRPAGRPRGASVRGDGGTIRGTDGRSPRAGGGGVRGGRLAEPAPPGCPGGVRGEPPARGVPGPVHGSPPRSRRRPAHRPSRDRCRRGKPSPPPDRPELRRFAMNVAFVDPIAATANYTGGNLLRPEVPSLCEDPRILEQTKLVELATEVARLGHRTTVLFGDVFLDGQEFTTSAGVHIAPVQTVMRFPFHPGILPAAPSLLGHEALREADVVQVSEFHQLSTFFSCVTAREAAVPVVLWQETYRQMRFPGSVYRRMYESTGGPCARARTGRCIPRPREAPD